MQKGIGTSGGGGEGGKNREEFTWEEAAVFYERGDNLVEAKLI